MRDYILSQAQSRETNGVVATAKRVVRNWKHHRDLSILLKLDDYLLNDMGISRALVQHLLALPLTIDVDWERERVLRMRWYAFATPSAPFEAHCVGTSGGGYFLNPSP